jgi:hypothetical protein
MLEHKDHVAGKSNQDIARRRPGNKGRRYPADPPRVEEIIAVMKQAGTDLYGRRLRGLIIVLWASRSSHLRGARPDRIGPGGHPRLGARPPGNGRTPPGGRYRRVGVGSAASLAPGTRLLPGWTSLLRDQRANLWPALVRLAGANCASTHRCPGRYTAALRTTPTAPRPRWSNWPERAYPSTSSSASWDMPTSGSPPSTCRASIAARSSRRSAHAALR